MPKYRNEFGVVFDIPEEKAARINGLKPVDSPSAPRKAAAPKKAAKSESA